MPDDKIYASEVILNKLVGCYKSFDFEEMVSEVETIKRAYLSLQDKQKLDYLCFRKAKDETNPEMIKYYARRVKNVIEFSEQLNNNVESEYGY